MQDASNMSPHEDGIWIIDRDGNTTYANERMADILGTTVSALQGAPSFSFVFPQDIDEAQRRFQMKEAGDSETFQFTLRRQDGLAVRVSVQGTPMRNASGDFQGIVGTFTPAGAPFPVSERQTKA